MTPRSYIVFESHRGWVLRAYSAEEAARRVLRSEFTLNVMPWEPARNHRHRFHHGADGGPVRPFVTPEEASDFAWDRARLLAFPEVESVGEYAADPVDPPSITYREVGL